MSSLEADSTEITSAELRRALPDQLQGLLSARQTEDARRRVWARVVTDILEADPEAGQPAPRTERPPDQRASGVA